MARRPVRPFTYLAVIEEIAGDCRLPIGSPHGLAHKSFSHTMSPGAVIRSPGHGGSAAAAGAEVTSFVVVKRMPSFDYEDSPLPDALVSYCFPYGSPFCAEHKEEGAKSFHVFCMIENDGNKLYGGCLTWRNSSGKCVAVCLLSHFAAFDAISTCLHALKALESSPGEYSLAQYAAFLTLQLPLPDPGNGIEFNIGGSGGGNGGKNVTFFRPDRTKLPQSHQSLGLVFKHLDFPNLFTTFTALMLEKKIVLHSPDIAVLTPFSEMLISLLFPLNWCQLYIPVLPELERETIIGGTAPFLVGVKSLKDITVPEDVIVIDLCHNTIKGADQLPELSDASASELIRSLCSAAARFGALPAPPPVNEEEDDHDHDHDHEHLSDDAATERMHQIGEMAERITEDAAASAAVRSAFLQFFVRLLSNYRSFVSLDDVQGGYFKTAEFTASLVPEQRVLMQLLGATDLFQAFAAARAAPTAATMKAQMELFDKCIEAFIARDDHKHSHACGADQDLGRRASMRKSVVRALCEQIETVHLKVETAEGGTAEASTMIEMKGAAEAEAAAATGNDRRTKRRLSLDQNSDAPRLAQEHAARRLLLAEVTRMVQAFVNNRDETEKTAEERDKRSNMLAGVLAGTLIKISEHGARESSADGASAAGEIEMGGGGNFMQRLLRKKIEVTAEPGGALWALVELGAAESKVKSLKDAFSSAKKGKTAWDRIAMFVLNAATNKLLADWMEQILTAPRVTEWIMMNRKEHALLRCEENVAELLRLLRIS